MDSLPPPLLYRVRDAMRLLSVSRPTIYRLIKKGDLVTVKIGTATRITADSIKDVSKVRMSSKEEDVYTASSA